MNLYSLTSHRGNVDCIEIRTYDGETKLWIYSEDRSLSLALSVPDAEKLQDKIGGALREHYASNMAVKV